jgi:sugar/nucleoside kinase (ribokinase family)
MVLSTPDAQRSFLSCFSNEDEVQLTPELQHAVASSKLLVVEGYLWELPGAAKVLPELVRLARSVGTLVALTAGDAGVVQRHGEKVLETLAAGVDIWFCNAAEAQALLGHLPSRNQQQQQQLEAARNDASAAVTSEGEPSPSSSSREAQLSVQEIAQQVSHLCPMMVVTDGSKGSYVMAFGELLVVPPYWSTEPPVDTTGAGDAYAAGFLYALLAGADLVTLGQSAARTASAVISRHGPQLLPEDAAKVVQALAGVVGASVSDQGMAFRGLLGGQAGGDGFPAGPSGLLAGPQA